MSLVKRGFIFDMDGVIVDTAKYHFQCWKNIAEGLGMTFTKSDNEKLKGVSRADSLEIILQLGNIAISQKEKDKLLIQKNDEYLHMVADMDRNEVLPGVEDLIMQAKAAGMKIALGSASKNARYILKAADIEDWFDAVVDGNDVTKAKPDPEVFLKAAAQINCTPAECIVFEDSHAGTQAARSAGILPIGIGDSKDLPLAEHCYQAFTDIPDQLLKSLMVLPA